MDATTKDDMEVVITKEHMANIPTITGARCNKREKISNSK